MDVAYSAMEPAMTGRDHKRREQQARLERLADWLDSRFRIPGTQLRFGLDGIIGLIPGVGDLFAGGLSIYLIAEAYQMKARKRTIARMLWNAAVDMVVGSIPVVGDLFDFVHKANAMNVRLLIAEHDRAARQRN